jgi:hypothetical protein
MFGDLRVGAAWERFEVSGEAGEADFLAKVDEVISK